MCAIPCRAARQPSNTKQNLKRGGQLGMKKLLALGALAIVASAPIFAQVNITGAGATFPYPMYSKWFDEYHKIDKNIQINYQSVGSGAGIKQATEGTVDFGASD